MRRQLLFPRSLAHPEATHVYRTSSSGQCIDGDSLVYTPQGAVKAAELAPGSLLYSFDDYTLAERTCLEVAPRGKRPVFALTLEDGRSILATDDQQLVKVVDPRTNIKWAMRWFQWQPLSEFCAGDMVICSRASPETLSQEPLLDDETAQFIGFRDASLAEYAINPFFDETLIELLNIVSAQPGGETEVYEVVVEGNESFVANGFVML